MTRKIQPTPNTGASSETNTRLALFFLGPIRVEREGLPIDVKLAKANALLVYLAVTGQAHSREALAALLWPEHDAAKAQSSLRSTLLALNTALGRDWLAADRRTVQLAPEAQEAIWLDTAIFNEAIDECRTHGHSEKTSCAECIPLLTEAVNLYRGDFLAGFSLRDSNEFDEWQSYQTEYFRREQAQALERLVQAHVAQGHPEAALTFARRWLALDSLHELAHEQLIRLYWQAGQRAEAMRQYQACAQILQKELGVPPSDALQALYRQIQKEEAPVLPKPPQPNVVEIPKPPLSPLIPIATPAPAASPARVLRNFPARLTPFLGRDEERAEIVRLLTQDAACRLVTLVGPGGIGKTRLALQAAEDASGVFADGATFVSLAPVSSPEFFASTIADALKFTFAGSEALNHQLLDYLQDKSVLLVLDNLEHLLEGADFIAEMLETAPRLKVLATSQERLNLQGEWLIKLEGLSFPDDETDEQAERYNAVQLFLQSARRAQPNFTLTPIDRIHIKRICQLVDGMPLAIELASTWVRMLSCAEIAKEIEMSLEFLAATKRNVPERHRSLRAVFEHAWKLLSEEERRVLRDMAAFRGGFPQEAAEAAANAKLPVLLSLVDRGLLRRSPTGRYHRHPVLWRYAVEKLNTDPHDRDVAHDRHCAYYASFLHQQANELKGNAQKTALEAIETDIENVRAAWRWALTHRKAAEIWLGLEGLYRFYDMRSWFQEGADTFGEAIKLLREGAVPWPPERLAALLGKLLSRQANFCYRLGQAQASRELWEESLEMLRQAGPSEELETAFALDQLSVVIGGSGELAEAMHMLQESLDIYRRNDDKSGLATALRHMGVVRSWSGGQAEEIDRDLSESLAIFKALGDLRSVSQTLNVLGVFASERHDIAEARRHLQECLRIYQELNDKRGIAMVLNNLGTLETAVGNFAEAKLMISQSIDLYRAIGNRLGVAHSQDSLAHAEIGLQHYARAREHLAESLRTTLELHHVPDAIETLYGFAVLLEKERRLSEALELVVFIVDHPKCLPELRERVMTFLNDLAAVAPEGAVERQRAELQARGTTMEAIVEKVLKG